MVEVQCPDVAEATEFAFFIHKVRIELILPEFFYYPLSLTRPETILVTIFSVMLFHVQCPLTGVTTFAMRVQLSGKFILVEEGRFVLLFLTHRT